jgi:hypothetical protein
MRPLPDLIAIGDGLIAVAQALLLLFAGSNTGNLPVAT